MIILSYIIEKRKHKLYCIMTVFKLQMSKAKADDPKFQMF